MTACTPGSGWQGVSDVTEYNTNHRCESHGVLNCREDECAADAAAALRSECDRLRAARDEAIRVLWEAKQWAALLYHHEGDDPITTRARVAKLWEAITKVQLPVSPPAASAPAGEPPCVDCGSATAERSACPHCGQVYCQPCAEKPYAYCCDGDAGQPPRAPDAVPLGGAPVPTCFACDDTHYMTMRGRTVMCTHCPTPCEKCRSDGRGPYCQTTPCACSCHASPAVALTGEPTTPCEHGKPALTCVDCLSNKYGHLPMTAPDAGRVGVLEGALRLCEEALSATRVDNRHQYAGTGSPWVCGDCGGVIVFMPNRNIVDHKDDCAGEKRRKAINAARSALGDL